MPWHARELAGKGVQLHWATNDAVVLEKLHGLIVESLSELTLSELRFVADAGKMLLSMGAPFIPADAPLPPCLKEVSEYVKRVV